MNSVENLPSNPTGRLEAKEQIRDAAVRYDGKIFEGGSHGHAYGNLLRFLKENEPQTYEEVRGREDLLVSRLDNEQRDKGGADFEGFITSHKRFISRTEATLMAQKTGQLKRWQDDGELYSENLRI